MVNDTENRSIQVGADILDPQRVTDRTYKVYEVTGVGEFVGVTRQYRDPQLIEEDRERGGDGTFEIVDFRLPVVQHWPDRGKGEDKVLQFDLTRSQADSIKDGEAPSLHVGTPLGLLARQFGQVGAPSPLDDEIQGEVFIVAEYSREYNGRQQRRYDIVEHVGNRLTFDVDAAAQRAIEESANNKRRVG